MTCGFCGSRNSDEEHRCGKCGRRPGDTADGRVRLHRTQGQLAMQGETPEVETRRSGRTAGPTRPSLFQSPAMSSRSRATLRWSRVQSPGSTAAAEVAPSDPPRSPRGTRKDRARSISWRAAPPKPRTLADQRRGGDLLRRAGRGETSSRRGGGARLGHGADRVRRLPGGLPRNGRFGHLKQDELPGFGGVLLLFAAVYGPDVDARRRRDDGHALDPV